MILIWTEGCDQWQSGKDKIQIPNGLAPVAILFTSILYCVKVKKSKKPKMLNYLKDSLHRTLGFSPTVFQNFKKFSGQEYKVTTKGKNRFPTPEISYSEMKKDKKGFKSSGCVGRS